MGICYSFCSNTKKCESQSIEMDSCTLQVDIQSTNDFDAGYSFIDFEMTKEQTMKTIQEKQQIVFNVHSKRICFDCVELYIWFKLNPEGALIGPFGSITLTQHQKQFIIKRTEAILSKKECIEQTSAYEWNIGDALPLEMHTKVGNRPVIQHNVLLYRYFVLEEMNLKNKVAKKCLKEIIKCDKEDSFSLFLSIASQYDVGLTTLDQYRFLVYAVKHEALSILQTLLQQDWNVLQDRTFMLKFIEKTIAYNKDVVFKMVIPLLNEKVSLVDLFSQQHSSIVQKMMDCGLSDSCIQLYKNNTQ